MIQPYKSRANLGILVGLVVSIGTRVAGFAMIGPIAPGSARPSAALLLGLTALSLVGTVIFVWGCVNYALAKGRSGWWGAFGLLSLIGLIVLVCLKDLTSEANMPRGFEPTFRS